MLPKSSSTEATVGGLYCAGVCVCTSRTESQFQRPRVVFIVALLCLTKFIHVCTVTLHIQLLTVFVPIYLCVFVPVSVCMYVLSYGG